jgi:hypothetical protein
MTKAALAIIYGTGAALWVVGIAVGLCRVVEALR